jgi:hypothetical protein
VRKPTIDEARALGHGAATQQVELGEWSLVASHGTGRASEQTFNVAGTEGGRQSPQYAKSPKARWRWNLTALLSSLKSGNFADARLRDDDDRVAIAMVAKCSKLRIDEVFSPTICRCAVFPAAS